MGEVPHVLQVTIVQQLAFAGVAPVKMVCSLGLRWDITFQGLG